MQIHELKIKNKNKARKRVGRGGKKGTYSSRGMKGQNSRAGRKFVPIIRELIKRYPKLKGYRRFVFENNTAIINLDILEKFCKDGDVVNPEFLLGNNLIEKHKGKMPEVKILGTGKLTKKITIESCAVSASAKTAIEKAGGKVV
jgi:large subunit ribosomal protein L15